MPELTFQARRINVDSFRVVEAWLAASVLYVSHLLLIAAGLRRLERRFPNSEARWSFLIELWIARRGSSWRGWSRPSRFPPSRSSSDRSSGCFVGIGLAFGWRPLRWPLRAYVDVVRGTPVLVLILASFYILAVFGVQFSATGAGMFALSLFCGAHLGEIVRGALQAIPLDADRRRAQLGLSMTQILALVLLPQALRQALPVWINTAVEIVKASTLLSIIGVGELLLKTQEIVGRTFLTLEFYLFAGLMFFLVNFSIERPVDSPNAGSH